MKRCKYNKASLDSAIACVRKVQGDQIGYILATYYGFVIQWAKPAKWQKYVRVSVGGSFDLIEDGEIVVKPTS